MEKKTTSKSLSGAKGGSTHMITGTSAGVQQPGQSASQKSGGGKFAVGGNGKMFHDGNGAKNQVPGQSTSEFGGDNNWGVKGGSGKMFGPQTAGTATAGRSVK
jgi:hypothetical protein